MALEGSQRAVAEAEEAGPAQPPPLPVAAGTTSSSSVAERRGQGRTQTAIETVTTTVRTLPSSSSCPKSNLCNLQIPRSDLAVLFVLAAQVARSTGAGAEAAAPDQRLDEFKARLGNLSPMEVRTNTAGVGPIAQSLTKLVAFVNAQD